MQLAKELTKGMYITINEAHHVVKLFELHATETFKTAANVFRRWFCKHETQTCRQCPYQHQVASTASVSFNKALVSNNAVIFFTFTAIETFINTLHMLPSFGQPPPTRRAKNTARYVRPSCVRRDWSDRLERTEQRPAWSRTEHRQLRSPTEDALISTVFGALSALEELCDNALYKLTSILTFKEHSSYLSTKPVLE